MAHFHFDKSWMEFFFVVLMIVGVLISFAAPSAAISYAIIFLCGIFAGRLIYEKKNKIQFPYFMIIAGFVLGYLLGVYYGSRIIMLALFAAGAVLSYKLYDKKIVNDISY